MATRPALTNPALAFSSGFSGTAAPSGLTSPTAPSLFAQTTPMAPSTSYTRPATTASQPAPPPLAPKAPSPLQPLAYADQTNPGYGEQALNYTQNRLLEDPYASTQSNLAKQASQPSQGQDYLNQNLGTLDGQGQGEQYWNQVSGQFQDPFAGEQYARNATQNMSPTGPAGAFYNQAMSQYGDFTGYSGPQASAGQYGANASSGPLAGQSFYDQVGGDYGTKGTYSDPNLAAGQYSQTQGAFGDMPLPDSADPYYDRAIQLGTQSYNQGAAGRGVYGSSEALSGVGNVITDLNAKRAQTAFGNQMSINTEQRMRQQLLGEQARAGDLSSLSAFGANLSGVETFGNLAKNAGDQTLGQQTMLGNQANDVDRNAQAAQNSNIEGVRTYGTLSNNADSAETDRYRATTGAMNAADQTQLERNRTGADIAFRSDDSARADYSASTGAAATAGGLDNSRLQTASGIASTGSTNDLSRVNSFNNTAQGAEGQRQTRTQSGYDNSFKSSKAISDILGGVASETANMSQADFENYITATLGPKLTAQGIAKQDQQGYINAARDAYNAARSG
jgi:hypothetical protein